MQTIFEINATARTMASTIMRSKRRHDRALIEKYQRGQQEKRAAALQGQGLRQAPPEPEEREGEEENLQVAGQGQGRAMVLGPARCPAGAWAPGLGWQGDMAPPAPPSPSQDVFSTVVGRKRKRGQGGEDGARKKPQQAVQRDEEFYVPYRPKDFESERG